MLRRLSEPIDVISLEFAPEFIESTFNCIRYLSKLGTANFNYAEGESMSLALSSWVDIKEALEMLTVVTKNTSIFGDVYVRFCGH